MINEISLVAGTLVVSLLGGLIGVVRKRIEERSSETRSTSIEMSWTRDTRTLAKNLLVLETIAEEFESSPLDIAVRTRLTPRELKQVETGLLAAGLIDCSTPNLIKLTAAGREILANHLIEETSAHRASHSLRIETESVEELDAAIGRAVAKLNTQPAH